MMSLPSREEKKPHPATGMRLFLSTAAGRPVKRFTLNF